MADLEHLEREFEKMHTDMYVGAGPANLPITTRLSMVEKAVENIEKAVMILMANMGKVVWLLIGILVTVIGNIVLVVLHALHLL